MKKITFLMLASSLIIWACKKDKKGSPDKPEQHPYLHEVSSRNTITILEYNSDKTIRKIKCLRSDTTGQNEFSLFPVYEGGKLEKLIWAPDTSAQTGKLVANYCHCSTGIGSITYYQPGLLIPYRFDSLEYNSNGHIIKMLRYSRPEGKLIFYQTYEWENGNISFYKSYNVDSAENPHQISQHTFSYDNRNNPLAVIRDYDMFSMFIDAAYSTRNNPTQQFLTEGSKGMTRSITYNYSYDNRNYPVKSHKASIFYYPVYEKTDTIDFRYYP